MIDLDLYSGKSKAMKLFGRHLKSLRKKLGLTVEDLALFVGEPTELIQMIEKGKCGIPTRVLLGYQFLCKLASKYGIDYEEWSFGTKEAKDEGSETRV